MSTRKPRQRIEPGPGQESVWDYPRPPALQRISERIRIELGETHLTDSTQALRICETSHPPTVYIPPADVATEFLQASDLQTFCEWKGMARYFHIVVPDEAPVPNAVWHYPEPRPAYRELVDHLAFYPSRVSRCFWGDEEVLSQAGDFYGGWITSKICGPFKGDPGTMHW